jgi:single-strand DNA-binding protein
VWEVTVNDAGPSLRYATAKVARASRDKVPPPEDPWAGSAPESSPGGYSDEPPF